jgi:methyl halide transferase
MSDPVTRDPEFWNRYYQTDHTPWQIHQACPPVFRLLDQRKDLVPGRLLIPGCGLGVEPSEFARRGFSVTAMDLSRYVIEEAKKKTESKLEIQFLVGNVCRPSKELFGAFDYVFEQTCYCALDPVDRPAYVKSVYEMLVDGGHLFGVFYRFDHGHYPPFPIGLEELREDFESLFDIEILELAKHSAAERKEREWLAHFIKRDNGIISD